MMYKLIVGFLKIAVQNAINNVSLYNVIMKIKIFNFAFQENIMMRKCKGNAVL